nr:hypothetical protein [Tanacetum cinerariifolium]
QECEHDEQVSRQEYYGHDVLGALKAVGYHHEHHQKREAHVAAIHRLQDERPQYAAHQRAYNALDIALAREAKTGLEHDGHLTAQVGDAADEVAQVHQYLEEHPRTAAGRLGGRSRDAGLQAAPLGSTVGRRAAVGAVGLNGAA